MKIQVIIESDDGRVQDVEEVACLKRGTLSPEELGLNLAEAKEILQSVQRSMTAHQVADYTAERINCPCCGQRRVQKGHHPILFRTLFGKLTLNSLRLHHCDWRIPFICRSTGFHFLSCMPDFPRSRIASGIEARIGRSGPNWSLKFPRWRLHVHAPTSSQDSPFAICAARPHRHPRNPGAANVALGCGHHKYSRLSWPLSLSSIFVISS